MSRKSDVNTIIAAATEQYEIVRKEYDCALQEQSLDLRVPVKNLMENLRSSLDYMAHDIYEACCQSSRATAGKSDPRNIYFPYGRTKADFQSGIGSSLPDLASNNRGVYDLIASIQPFRCNDTWLYDLCSILNEKKHDKLKAQERSETEIYTVESEHGSVSTIVNNPNVKITSMPGAVKIFGVPAEFTSNGIRTAPSDKLAHKRTKWIAFTFEGADVNVIGMLDKAVTGIIDFANRLYTLI
ncbi:MAG: hypothetical protein FVQ84_01500 [Planctomycetes bacterium]|nr:hypothetical protein [Planctomycetota bacterium]